MKIFLITLISLIFLVAVTGVWKMAPFWLIETATSFPQVFDYQYVSPAPEPLDVCHVDSNRMLSTPELIDCAFKDKKITLGQRLLYLSYSLGDFKKLPKEYEGTTPWDGTLVALELNETVTSKEKFCVLDKNIQDELRKSFPQAAQCQ